MFAIQFQGSDEAIRAEGESFREDALGCYRFVRSDELQMRSEGADARNTRQDHCEGVTACGPRSVSQIASPRPSAGIWASEPVRDHFLRCRDHDLAYPRRRALRAVATAGWPAPKGRRTDHHALYRCLLSGSQVGNQFVIEPLTDPLDSMWTTLEQDLLGMQHLGQSISDILESRCATASDYQLGK